MSGTPQDAPTDAPPRSGGAAFGLTAKRLFDRSSSAIALLLLAPFFIVIAILVRLDSRGPVFYRAPRSGLHGQPFDIYKFRTMTHDRTEAGALTTAHNDPRVTRVGRVLRRTKIDELPQLINVFTGDMSIVGPRPEMPEYTALYDAREQAILSVRPGITDYASVAFVQLTDVVGDEDPDAAYFRDVWRVKNDLRLRYVEGRSFFGDLVLIFRTFWVLLRSIRRQGD